MLVSFVAYYSNLNMETTWTSETSVDFQRTTRRHIPEDRHLHNHRCENPDPFGRTIPVSNPIYLRLETPGARGNSTETSLSFGSVAFCFLLGLVERVNIAV
jgi:hypothetical protein